MIEASVWFSGWICDVLLGLERLVQAFRIAPARHHAAGELVDDHHFVVADDVVLVALEQLVRPQGRVEVMDERRRSRCRRAISPFRRPSSRSMLLELFDALVGEGGGAVLFVELEIALADDRDERVERFVELRAVLERAGNDQRRARLVDEDGVDFVDDRVVVSALDHLVARELHVVAQIVEAEFVVGAVGDVGGVGRLALVVVRPCTMVPTVRPRKL